MPFLGALVSESSSELIWEQHFSPFELVFLQDHRVGSVPLLPGTCYIEMARAVVRAAHDEASAFDLTSVAFSTILFLDEADITPNVRVSLDRRPGTIQITSQREDGSSDTHGTMTLRLSKEKEERLELSTVRARCTEHVTATQFYQQCGNDYRGEFKAMADAWGSESGGEILSRVAYDHSEALHVHLRSCAWLDACLHAPYWWSDHRSRPFYIASVRSYGIRSMDCSRNRVMWSLMHGLGGSDDLQPDVLKYHSDDLRCRVQIDGSRLGFFEVGWLERRRVHRHLYSVEWRVVEEEQEPSSSAASAVLFDSATASTRSVAINGAIGTLCLGSSGRMGVLSTLSMLSAAMSLLKPPHPPTTHPIY